MMNELSWLLYAADVVGNLRHIAGMALFAPIPLVLFGGLGWLMARDFADSDEDEQRINKVAVRVGKSVIPWFVAAVVIVAFVPSKGTVYAIAASEVGERVIESETGGKAVEALNAWLDRQISGTPAE